MAWHYTVFATEGLPGGQQYVPEVLHFEFEAPTPEPATILLCGSGIVGALFRRKRQQ